MNENTRSDQTAAAAEQTLTRTGKRGEMGHGYLAVVTGRFNTKALAGGWGRGGGGGWRRWQGSNDRCRAGSSEGRGEGGQQRASQAGGSSVQGKCLREKFFGGKQKFF